MPNSNSSDSDNSRIQGNDSNSLNRESSQEGMRSISNTNGGGRTDPNIFDRFMDIILGDHRNRQQQGPTVIPIIAGDATSISSIMSSTSSASRSTGDQDPAHAVHGQRSGEPRTDNISNQGQSNNANVVNGIRPNRSQGVNAEGTSPDTDSSPVISESSNGAIIITVNYVFSDDNNRLNPNRSGSLVVTLPNSPSNRDPRIIQEFIRLATEMAYSSIVNGLNKHKGITVEKFKSFEIKSKSDLPDETSTCAICFETYTESCVSEKKSDMPSSNKKRKLNRSDLSPVLNTPLPDGADLTNTGENSSGPQLLADYSGTFEHLPAKMPCGHIFGQSCLCEWLVNHNTCPLCRESVEDPLLTSEAANNPESTEQVSGTSNLATANRPMQLIDFMGSLRRNGGHPITGAGRGVASENNTENDILGLPTSSTPPSEAQSSQGTNGSNENGILYHLLTFLRRPHQHANASSLLTSGDSSRRTSNGVENRLTDRVESENSALDYMNLQSLIDESNDNNPGSLQTTPARGGANYPNEDYSNNNNYNNNGTTDNSGGEGDDRIR